MYRKFSIEPLRGQNNLSDDENMLRILVTFNNNFFSALPRASIEAIISASGKKSHTKCWGVFYEDASLHLSGSDKASRLFETASIWKDLDLEMENGLVFTTNPIFSGYYTTALKKKCFHKRTHFQGYYIFTIIYYKKLVP